MTTRRALLIGVPAYEDEATFPSLEFVVGDLDDLEKSLASAGYAVERHPVDQTEESRMDQAVADVLHAAGPDDPVLIVLSGHGLHHDGRDYLVPGNARASNRKFPQNCFEIDFDGHVEDPKVRCGDVLVVVDACRSGVLAGQKGQSIGWGARHAARVAGRTVAYLYACSSGEVAQYAKAVHGYPAFSVYTRAFSAVVADPEAPAVLTEFLPEVERRMNDLIAEHDLKAQNPKLEGQLPDRPFVLADRPPRPRARLAPDAWHTAVRDHVAWTLMRDAPGAENAVATDLLQEVAKLVQSWAERYQQVCQALRQDPWWDTEGAARIQDTLSWLLVKVLHREKMSPERGQPPLSPGEAALLVLVPYAQALHHAESAARWRGVAAADPPPGADADAFAQFVQGHVRLSWRLARVEADGRGQDARAIRWWLFHRWLARDPKVYDDDWVAATVLADQPADPSGLLAEVATPDRLSRILRALRGDPEAFAPVGLRRDGESDVTGGETVAAGKLQEQRLRLGLLVPLLLVAEELTLDATRLPVVMAEHIGLPDGVRPAEVLATVRAAGWLPRSSRTRVLEAECSHQAVQQALTEHTAGISEVLRRIDALVTSESHPLRALADLPAHASADRLRAGTDADGAPRYTGLGFRFRLDDDRVQQLLMGEQLYGDPALAIRELYQNALDACRYRRARTAYLRDLGLPLADWQGQITFSQGRDEATGQAWLECRDTGVGMGEVELSTVFSNAGTRFAELPEYLEENADWPEHIRFTPNSRFGIGVLSYFMLADEMTVTTTRFSRGGALQEELEVSIAGPGSLCRVRRTGRRPTTSGTTVRLHLHEGVTVSCVELLTRLLWVSEFAVTANDGARTARWLPGEISESAPIGTHDANDPDAERDVRLVQATAEPDVWWCDGQGAVLADGLWAGLTQFGRVVNLTGEAVPRLTVDRRRAVGFDPGRSDARARAAVDDLLRGEGSPLVPDWLMSLTQSDPDLADAVGAEAVVGGARWRIVSEDPPAVLQLGGERIGLFPPDEGMFSAASDAGDEIIAWRFRMYVDAGLAPGLRTSGSRTWPLSVIARPTDARLLSRDLDGVAPWLDLDEITAADVLNAAVRLREAPADVAARLHDLGATLPDRDWPHIPPTDHDARLLSRDLNGVSPWISDPVPPWHLLRAAVVLGTTPGLVAKGLLELGLTLPTYLEVVREEG